MIVWRVVRGSFFRQVAKRWKWIQENTSVSPGSTPCSSWGETRGDVTPCQSMAMAGSFRRIHSACCFRHTVLSSMRRYRRNRSTSASRRRILPESGTGNRRRRPIPWRPIGKKWVRISEDRRRPGRSVRSRHKRDSPGYEVRSGNADRSVDDIPYACGFPARTRPDLPEPF